jgi:hypothetical protein
MRYSFQILVSIIFSLPGSTFGQVPVDHSKRWEIGASLILPFERTVDPRFSNIEAKGIGFGAGLSVAREFAHTFLQISMDKRSSNLTDKADYDLKQSSILLEGSFGWLFNNRDDSKLLFGVGLNSVFLRSSRVVESFSNFNKSQESIGFIAVNFRLKTQLSQTHRLRLQNSLSIPIVSINRNEEFGTGEGSSSAWISSFFLSNVFLRNSSTLGWQISRTSCIGIDYTWVYYEVKSRTKKMSTSHQFGLKYIMSL